MQELITFLNEYLYTDKEIITYTLLSFTPLISYYIYLFLRKERDNIIWTKEIIHIYLHTLINSILPLLVVISLYNSNSNAYITKVPKSEFIKLAKQLNEAEREKLEKCRLISERKDGLPLLQLRDCLEEPKIQRLSENSTPEYFK